MKDQRLNLLEISSTGQSADFLIATLFRPNLKLILSHQQLINQRRNKIKKIWMIGHLDMETIPPHGAIKIKNMFKQNQQLKIKYNQLSKHNHQQLQFPKRNKTRKI
jgi:1,2-phenylacetyl-CoA epoxidase PaaB subunit